MISKRTLMTTIASLIYIMITPDMSLAAWKNLCPDHLLCPNETTLYSAPGTVHNKEQIVTISYQYLDTQNNDPLTTRLLVSPDRTEVPAWDSAYQPSGTFMQHSSGNWISMANSTINVLDHAGKLLHSFDHPQSIFYFDIVDGPILEQAGRLYFSLRNTDGSTYKVFISDDAGLSWYTTDDTLLGRNFTLYPNPFGKGLLAVGLESINPMDPSWMTALFHLTISRDGVPNLIRMDDLLPVSSYGARMNAIAFDFEPDDLDYPVIYAASNKGILTSRDKGRSWIPLGGLRFTEPVNNLVVINHQQSKLIVASTVNSGIWASRDQGINWKPFGQGLLDGETDLSFNTGRNNPAEIYYQGGQLLARTQGGWYRCADFDCEGNAVVAPAVAKRATIPIVEFYNSDLDHYFMTSSNSEIAQIENGQAGLNWSRTGFTFTAWTPLGLNAGKSVCRFYGSQSPGPNSHFFSASADECDALHQLQKSTPAEKPRWNFEGLPFMVAKGRVANAEECAEGHIPVYRAYNNGYARGVDSNHRFVADHAEIDKLVAKGWADEGIAFCALP